METCSISLHLKPHMHARGGAGGGVGETAGAAGATGEGSPISKEDIEARLLGDVFENQVAASLA